MGVDDPGHDGQAEAGAGAARLRPPSERQKRSKSSLGVVGRQAGAVVAYLEADRPVLARGADADRGPGRRVDERVAQQVGEDLAQLVGVAGDGDPLLDTTVDLAVGRGRARVVDRVADEAAEVDLDVRGVRDLVEAGEGQEIFHEHAHARRLLLDAPHRLLDVGGLAGGAHAEELGVAADRGQRRAQLVRGVGEELAQAVLARLARGERPLEAVEHRVERDAEAADLGARVGRLDAVRQVAAGDRAGRVAHAVEREQPDAHDDPGGGGEQQEDAADHERLDGEQAAQGLVDVAHRDRDDRRGRRERIALGEHAVVVGVAVLAVDGERAADRDALGRSGSAVTFWP